MNTSMMKAVVLRLPNQACMPYKYGLDEFFGYGRRFMDPILQLAYRTMAALEQVSGLPFPALATIVIAGAIVIGLIAGRRMFRPPAAPHPVPKEPLQQLTTDRATLEPENPALTGYGKMLEARGIAATEQHALIREYAGQLDDLRQRMDEIASGLDTDDAVLLARLSEARAALDGGSVEQAVAVLGSAGVAQSEIGRELRHQAGQRLMGATLLRLVAGDLEMAAQNIPAAAEHYREAIEAVPSGNEALLAECLNKHGTAMYRSRNAEAAAISFKRAAKLVERVKGANHPDVATALNNLAMLYYVTGEFSAAEQLYQRALGIDEYALGPDATAVGTDLNNLALLYKKQGRLEDAEPLMKRALAIKTKHFDPGHPSLLTGLRNYAALLRALGREEEAESFEVRADALPPKRRPDDADN
ncbi:MAG: tetratricopeptide repeat protein [Alphaproteobacteria bacterium]|nr:tetratricopeptide repeat protein [Alphaproteobacteria bacterium]